MIYLPRRDRSIKRTINIKFQMKTEFEQNKKYKINLVLILSGDKTEKLVSKIRNKEIINLKNIEYYFIEEKR